MPGLRIRVKGLFLPRTRTLVLAEVVEWADAVVYAALMEILTVVDPPGGIFDAELGKDGVFLAEGAKADVGEAECVEGGGLAA